MVQGKGRIAGEQAARVLPWQPAENLEKLSQAEARFSRGFLPAPLSAWFENSGDLWTPLFHTLASNVKVAGVKKAFSFPDNLHRTVLADAEEAQLVIGVDKNSFDVITAEVAPEGGEVSAEIVMEYIERRLLATVTRSWTGSEPFACAYIDAEDNVPSEVLEKIQIAASICVEFMVSGSQCALWFGLAPKIVERLDSEWRTRLLRDSRAKGINPLADQIHQVQVELAELSVPHAMLIDYLRSGTVIDLELPVTPKVSIKVDGELWADGELCQFNQKYAVRIEKMRPISRPVVDGTTNMSVTIASLEMDQEGLIEYAQSGAVMLSDASVAGLDAQASLIISGEDVATASVGQLDGSFALTVQPKEA